MCINTEDSGLPTSGQDSYKTYEATDLADVILFEAEAKATSANYMLVLSANAIGKDLLELNVVFEDGTVQAVEVDDDGGLRLGRRGQLHEGLHLRRECRRHL